MKINGKEVSGIKKAVGDANRECADRWAIMLDMSDWSVYERGLIGQDYFVMSWPIVQIACGYANSIFGKESISMQDIKNIIEKIIDCRKRAAKEYQSGQRHQGWWTGEDDEPFREYVRVELQAEGLI